MEELTIQDTLDWAQDPLQRCGEAPVILQPSFQELSEDLAAFTDHTSKTAEEIFEILEEQAKRFSGCGGNFADRTGMIRRNPNNGQPDTLYGWQYILDLIK